jgi:hydroxyethylthiazole kinase-like uncharacterized protein yjeF
VIRRQGIDVLAVERMVRALARTPGFVARAFTPAELAQLGGSAERLAGRWAAKEAVIKCFAGTPICFPRRRIEILNGKGGAPQVRLLGEAAGARVQVSISHQAGIAVASAWLEMPDPSERLLPRPGAVRLPERPAEGHKGTFGTVVAVAGSRGFTGAAYLCSTAAARAGAGLVRLLVAEGIYQILAVKCTEVMATPLPEAAPGALGAQVLEEVVEHLRAARCGVVGPGLGRHPQTWTLARELVERVPIPLVVDADALNALADSPALLDRMAAAGPRVLTPHPGEMARLVGRPTSELQRDRPGTALEAARRWRAVVVLKGAGTVVAAPDGRVAEDPHRVPALATGGTGDVLAGLVAGLVAQGSEPFEAAVTGVYVHAAAGRRIQARRGCSGLLASDLLDELPLVMKELREGG